MGDNQPTTGEPNACQGTRLSESLSSTQLLLSHANIDSGALDVSSHAKIHPGGIMEIDLEGDSPDILEGSPGPWNHSQSN